MHNSWQKCECHQMFNSGYQFMMSDSCCWLIVFFLSIIVCLSAGSDTCIWGAGLSYPVTLCLVVVHQERFESALLQLPSPDGLSCSTGQLMLWLLSLWTAEREGDVTQVYSHVIFLLDCQEFTQSLCFYCIFVETLANIYPGFTNNVKHGIRSKIVVTIVLQ